MKILEDDLKEISQEVELSRIGKSEQKYKEIGESTHKFIYIIYII